MLKVQYSTQWSTDRCNGLILIALKTLTIQLHRYIGIPVSVIVVMWFLSGIVMMYTRGMPALTESQSLQLASTIPVAQIALTPAEVMRRNDLALSPQTLTINTLQLRPVYRFPDGIVIFADDGERFDGIDEQTGQEIVATAFQLPTARVVFSEVLFEPDQWTITERRHLPLLKYTVVNEHYSEAYVSMSSGEIVLVTDRKSRFLAWIGAIPHWIYFTGLRTNQPAWFWTIIILSGIACLVSMLGLVLIVTQFEKSSPLNLHNSIRYRGLMRWHYLAGVLFGLLALTWLFSGLLSMDPFDWNQRRGIEVNVMALNAGAPLTESIDGQVIASLSAAPTLKKIEIRNVLSRPGIFTHHADTDGNHFTTPVNFAAVSGSPTASDYVSVLEKITNTPVLEVESLNAYDHYYYDRDHEMPLPVLRVDFDDAEQSTVYLNPATGKLVGQTHRLARVDRWLFNGLHSLDFAFWYDNRPLWDVAVIALSLGGLATSGTGLVLGVRRFRRWLVRRSA